MFASGETVGLDEWIIDDQFKNRNSKRRHSGENFIKNNVLLYKFHECFAKITYFLLTLFIEEV